VRREDTSAARPTERFRRGRRALGLAALTVTVAVVTSGCSVDEVLRFGWPVGVTPEAAEMRTLWTWSAVAALVVGAIVWGLTAWTVAFHRRKADASELPRQFQYNLPLELVLTVVPLIIVGVLFYFTVIVQNNVDRNAAGNELKVEITGFQWNWEFAYPDSRAPNNLPVATVGTTSTVPLLVLPTNTPIAFTQHSEDVIHSFWVPEFLFKRDVLPYPEKNDQKNTWVIQKIDHPGSFVGRCAEYCGSYHAMMNFEVRALPPDLFARYMQVRQTVNPATGQGFSAADALAELGSERRDCGELCTPTSVTTQVFNPDPTADVAFK
jgi:cytochrome c oxidase subunit II